MTGVTLKTPADIAILREGGRRLAKILQALKAKVAPGVTTGELDELARELIQAGGDEPSFLNYQPAGAPAPYQAALCVSVNDEVVHGIPGPRVIKEGDVVGLDLGLKHQNLFTDMAITVPVGKVTKENSKLLKITKQALDEAIGVLKPGAHLGDIGATIEKVAKEAGYGLVRDLGGHGVGYQVHEEPLIANFGKTGKGFKLETGMVLAIEPMFNLGSGEVIFLPDGYVVKTKDGQPSAHFEHTVLITAGAPEVLTTL